jgi:hypothetical protein
MGNHDILHSNGTMMQALKRSNNKLAIECFSFVHDINDTANENSEEVYVSAAIFIPVSAYTASANNP